MSVITLKPPKERQPGPYPAKRRCESCGCFLRTCNPASVCDPCSGNTQPTQEQVFERISSMQDIRQRRAAFDAYAEMQERKAA